MKCHQFQDLNPTPINFSIYFQFRLIDLQTPQTTYIYDIHTAAKSGNLKALKALLKTCRDLKQMTRMVELL